MAITKKDIAREKAREKYVKEITKLSNDVNNKIDFHVSQQMTHFYNKALRIAEKYVIAFEENYKVLKDE